MIFINEHEHTIVKCSSEDLPENVIGAAVLVESDKVSHAGIFVRYNGDSKLFHFTGVEVLIEDLDDKEVYFFKEFPFIKPALTASFLAHCQIVMKEAKPKLGFFYVGAGYNENGKFHSPGDFPEYMTCVGFCLTFLKFFTEGVDLFEVGDWNETNMQKSDEYIAKFLNDVQRDNPGIDINSFRKGLRRIWPIDYFTGTFSSILPVRRSFVDSISPAVNGTLLKKARA